MQDMLRSRGLARFGWVEGVGAVPRSAPRHMADGAPFFTDGLRAGMQLTSKQVPLDQVQLFQWETPTPR